MRHRYDPQQNRTRGAITLGRSDMVRVVLAQIQSLTPRSADRATVWSVRARSAEIPRICSSTALRCSHKLEATTQADRSRPWRCALAPILCLTLRVRIAVRKAQ
jgi:hypothetical protein